MRPDGKHLDRYRRSHPKLGPSEPGSLYGYFVVIMPDGELSIISSGEHHKGKYGDWEHVSVRLPDRCPTWEEMCHVKDLFWMEGECVMQFHPPKAEYINNMPFCLHLWKPMHPVELPPSITVGISKAAKRMGLRRMIRGK